MNINLEYYKNEENGYLIKQFEESPTIKEDYFIHVEVLENLSELVANRINSYMIQANSFNVKNIF